MAAFNISYTKRGGMRFLKVGRLTVSWSVSSSAERPAKAPKRKRYTEAQVSKWENRAYHRGYSHGSISATRH